jgi:hypothetical protein
MIRIALRLLFVKSIMTMCRQKAETVLQLFAWKSGSMVPDSTAKAPYEHF